MNSILPPATGGWAADIADGRLPRPPLGRHACAEFYSVFPGVSGDAVAGRDRSLPANQHPYSWASLGVDVRGRSHTLKVCYGTSQQIRLAADRLLPTVLRDSDGLDDERRGIISVFAGPPPEVKSSPTIAAEAESVREVVSSWLGEGIAAHEIGLFVRTPELVVRARGLRLTGWRAPPKW